MTVEFRGEVTYWRGPAPFYWIVMPEGPSAELKQVSNLVTYGWGCLPANVTIGYTEWYTALMPKDGKYLVPLKVAYRRALKLEEGDMADVRVEIGDR